MQQQTSERNAMALHDGTILSSECVASLLRALTLSPPVRPFWRCGGEGGAGVARRAGRSGRGALAVRMR